jgi:putative transposase
MITEYQLTAADVRHQTMKTLTEHLSLEANGYRCTTEMVLDVVLKASAERSSVEAACKDLVGVAASNTVREYLNAALDVTQLREQEAEMNAALAGSIPVAMKRQGLEVAIDFHDEPFYGQRPDLLAVACRGKAKQGTTHFIRFASAYVIWRQVRLTLAIHYVLPEEAKLTVLQTLLSRLKDLGFSFRVLYLDKAFAAGPLLRYLTALRQPALIACPIRGKQGGTRALCRGRKSYRTDYTFTDGTMAHLALVASLVPDKTGKRRRKWLAFIVVQLDWAPQKIYPRYRRRFGIECSYRSMRQARARTTSRNPALRFFLLAVGLVLVNTWVFLRWEFARLIAPGPRRTDPQRLRFHRFTRLLVRSIEALYGSVMAIPTHVLPESVIY